MHFEARERIANDLRNNMSFPTENRAYAPSLRDCDWAKREELLLAPYATFAKTSEGRRYEESAHPYRSPFQRDRDRILHSAAFRRLSGKMQVFTGDMGDYHRTRLTHTHEVSTVARTIGRVLRLNEDLIESLALVHDIGHPPYGHSGEDALNACLRELGTSSAHPSASQGFSHNAFALVLVEELETRYTAFPGLNLSREVLHGQQFRITHAGEMPLLEVQVVDLADSIAYNAHDVDDALTLGLLRPEQLEQLALVQRAQAWGSGDSRANASRAGLGAYERQKQLVHSLIDVQVADVLEVAQERLRGVAQLDGRAVRDLEVAIELSPLIASEKEELSQFLFANVYRHPRLMKVRESAAQRVTRLFERLMKNVDMLPESFRRRATAHGTEVAVRDYIAGMTDRFCDFCFSEVVEKGVTSLPRWER